MSRKLFRNLSVLVCSTVLIVLISAIVFGVWVYRSSAFPSSQEVRLLSEVTYVLENNDPNSLVLPETLKNLSPHTNVTLYAEVDVKAGECLLVETVYTSLNLYANDKLIYSSGQAGSYPEFLLDPPTMIAIVPLPETQGMQEFRFEYRSPTQRSTMSVPAVSIGEEAALFLRVFQENAFSLLFSLLLILLGSVMAVASLILIRGIPQSSSFLWLGLYAVATGIWGFGECDLTFFWFPHPSLLYMLAFIGLFTLAIPLLQYGLLVLNPQNKMPMRMMLFTLVLASAVAFVLQLCGVVSLSRSMYVFHFLVPLAFLVFAGCLIWEYIRYRNKNAQIFAFPILALALSAVMEVINYNVRFTNLLSLFFQIGTLVFFFSLCIVGVYFTRDALRTEAAKAQLELEVAATGRQLALQREQYDILTGSIEAAKKARHDIRHQLTALQGYADMQDIHRIQSYLAELLGSLSVDTESPLCENYAVNAIVNYYKAAAEKEHIHTELKLNVPENAGSILAADLCIVFGNLLENAIEACTYMSGEGRFIRVRADMQKGHLIVTVDNSFDGRWREKDGIFYSRKRTGENAGIGIPSVQAIAEKYNGYAEFKVNRQVFEASAALRIAR